MQIKERFQDNLGQNQLLPETQKGRAPGSTSSLKVLLE